MAMIKCPECGREISDKAKACPGCGSPVKAETPEPAKENNLNERYRGTGKKPKKKGGKLKWIVIAIIAIFVIGSVSGRKDDPEKQTADSKKVGAVNSGASDPEQKEEQTNAESASSEEVQTVYYVGDILQDGNEKIVYMSSGEYKEENDYMQPEEGYKYIFLQFAFENTSDSSDISVSFYNFEGYADGYNVDAYYGADDSLSASLSPGRSTMGYLYFEVPVDAEEIEVEYDTNMFTSEKITFVYEGEKDSGYQIEANTKRAEGALSIGDVLEINDVSITYISCEDYISDNQFVQPKKGYHFISCEIEFENNGDSDKHITSYSFDCYADGVNCDQTFIRDDDFSATISSGRKANGSVTFSVPDDAEVIEVEYVENVWTSKRIVFTVK